MTEGRYPGLFILGETVEGVDQVFHHALHAQQQRP